jgi:DNA uptake protein ComE-like DNA-binding protein
MENINNNLMTEKLLTKLWTDHKVWNMKETLSSIKVIAEWLNFVQGGLLNYARMRTTKVEVNTSSGTVQKPNIATAIMESSSSKVNVSTAQTQGTR